MLPKIQLQQQLPVQELSVPPQSVLALQLAQFAVRA